GYICQTKGGQPYHFVRWGDNGDVLQYNFLLKDGKLQSKKVFVHELREALTAAIDTGNFSPAVFMETCQKTKGRGRCGYAVMGRCLELLGVASLVGPRKGFKITNIGLAQKLIQ
ncbi:MAG: hypothetical protein V1724_07460, partial [Chloroflexota bacterium]